MQQQLQYSGFQRRWKHLYWTSEGWFLRLHETLLCPCVTPSSSWSSRSPAGSFTPPVLLFPCIHKRPSTGPRGETTRPVLMQSLFKRIHGEKMLRMWTKMLRVARVGSEPLQLSRA